jgi:hypothetical protein
VGIRGLGSIPQRVSDRSRLEIGWALGRKEKAYEEDDKSEDERKDLKHPHPRSGVRRTLHHGHSHAGARGGDGSGGSAEGGAGGHERLGEGAAK